MAHTEESTGTPGTGENEGAPMNSTATQVAGDEKRLVGKSAATRRPGADSASLAGEWRRLRRAATAVAIFTSPLFFVLLYHKAGWSFLAALAATLGAVIAFRGLVDVAARKLLPWPSMYGVERHIAEEDVVARRRTRFWRLCCTGSCSSSPCSSPCWGRSPWPCSVTTPGGAACRRSSPRDRHAR